MSKRETKRPVKPVKEAQEVSDDPLEAFAPKASAKDHFWDAINAYRLDWMIGYSTVTPYQYLRKVKDLSHSKAVSILARVPPQNWYDQKQEYLNQVSENVAKRHIDAIVEAQGQYVKASQLGLAKCLDMLSKINTEPLLDSKGHELKTKSGKPVYRPRSLDVLNLMNAIKTGQEIYRKAMGLKDEDGLQSVINVIQGDQINVESTINSSVNVVEQIKDELTYDEILMFIEEKRRKLALPSADEAVEVDNDS